MKNEFKKGDTAFFLSKQRGVYTPYQVSYIKESGLKSSSVRIAGTNIGLTLKSHSLFANRKEADTSAKAMNNSQAGVGGMSRITSKS